MNTYETIIKRRTIRKFTQEKIDKKLLMDCLNAARLAPSSRNRQPLEFILITEDLDRIFDCTRWAGYLKDGTPKEDERPTAYIAILINTDINKEAKYDVGLAAENIVLTAQEKGIASCILAAIDREKLSQILGIPSNYTLELLIALGYPKQESFVEEFKGDVKYWLDEEGNLHVPKRSLKDIVHEEKF